MPNQIFKKADDTTPFAPLVSSPTDPDPDPFKTLSGGNATGRYGTPWKSYTERRARDQADEATAKEQGSKASKLAAAKKKRKGNSAK